VLLYKDRPLPNSLRLDLRGVTALEYALLSALIAVAIVSSVAGFGTRLASAFTYINGALP